MKSSKLKKGVALVLEREGFACSDHRFGMNSHIATAEGWETFITKLEAWVDTWTLPLGFYVTEDLPCRYLIDVCQSNGLELPQAVATTRRTLERRFRDSLDRTIADEIGRFWLERAKRHLVGSDAALKVVGQHAGFTGVNHLYRAFIRLEGISPTEFRQQHQRRCAASWKKSL